MSYNGSGTFNINSAGQPVVTGTVISTTAFNALTADLGTGLSTAITKDGQTVATARIPFAAGINSSLVTDATNTTTGSIITAGGVGIAKALFVGTTANIAGTTTLAGVTATSITDSGLTSGRVTYAGTAGLLQDSANLTFSGSALAVTGTLSATTGAAVGGATAGAGGLAFPATAVAVADANTLDDYEEGTWTPTISGHVSAGAGTYTVQTATYTKVGRTVHVQADITWTAHTGTGNIRLSALPFTVMAGAGNYGSFSIGVLDNVALTAGNYATAWTNINSTNVVLQQTPTGGGVGAEVPMDTAGSIIYSGTYFV